MPPRAIHIALKNITYLLRPRAPKSTEDELPLGSNYREYTVEPAWRLEDRQTRSLQKPDPSNVDFGPQGQDHPKTTTTVDERLLKKFPLGEIPISKPPYLQLCITGGLLLVSYTVGTVGVSLLVFHAEYGIQDDGSPIAAIVIGYLFALLFAEALWLVCRGRLVEWKVQSEALSLESEKWKLFLREKEREARYLTGLGANLHGTKQDSQGPGHSARLAIQSQESTLGTSKLTPRDTAPLSALPEANSFGDRSHPKSLVPITAPLKISKPSQPYAATETLTLGSRDAEEQHESLPVPPKSALRFVVQNRQAGPEEMSGHFAGEISELEGTSIPQDGGTALVTRPALEHQPIPYPSDVAQLLPRGESASPRSRPDTNSVPPSRRGSMQEKEQKKAHFQQRLIQRRQDSDPSLAYFTLREHERASAESLRYQDPKTVGCGDHEDCPQEETDRRPTDSDISQVSGWTHRLDLSDSGASLALPPQALEEHPALREGLPKQAQESPDAGRQEVRDSATTNSPQRAGSLQAREDSVELVPIKFTPSSPQGSKKASDPNSASPDTVLLSPHTLNGKNLTRNARPLSSDKKVARWVDDFNKAPEADGHAESLGEPAGESSAQPKLHDRSASLTADIRSAASRTLANESQAVGPPSTIRFTPGGEGEMMWCVEENLTMELNWLNSMTI